ncbi:18720_t:CDS:2, partial [Racocetra fulgida]
KTYKTCANCLINKAEKRKKLDTNNTQPIMETISTQFLCNYIENLISNVENNNGISFEIRIDLNDDIFSEVEPNDLKSIVRIIVDEVEEGDDYREYKQSNRKRIARFDCHGKLTLHVDAPAMEAILKLRHDIIHEKPEDVSTPEEIKQEIRTNLHLDPIQIQAAAEFSFINPKFKPELNRSDPDYYQ